MTTRFTDTSALDVPIGAHPDPSDFIRAAMAWHFDAETGSPFWLERAKSLGFDPRKDITTFEDLRRFPNVTDELRDIPAEKLIPRGFGPHPDVVGVIETGGTTGAPKRIPMLREFADKMVAAETADFELRGVPHNKNWLMLFPSGPHGAFETWRRAASAYGVLQFGVDIDPRWVKKLIAAGKAEEADAYAEHVIDQAAFVLQSQNLSTLQCTPPLLARLARRDDLVDLIRSKVRLIRWGGASMDPDTRYFYRTSVFPEVELASGYGTTMALGAGAQERRGLSDDDPCIHDPDSPHVTVWVVDPETGQQVAQGARGQVIFHHVSRSFFLPNNAERDLATRMEGVAGQIGDSIADIAPMSTFEGAPIIEGVY